MSEDYFSRLEEAVRRLYGCKQHGLSGMVSADMFELQPLLALTLVIAYAYASGKEGDQGKYADVFEKYYKKFNGTTNPTKTDYQKYVNDIKNIIENL